MPGIILDSTGDTMGGGHLMPDPFNDKLNCIEYRVNNKQRPDCLIGYATKDLPAGALLYSARGKDWWSNRGQLQSLGPKAKVTCRKYYDIKEIDIVD